MGVFGDDVAGEFDVGSAYVYRFNGMNWIEEAHLLASDGLGWTPGDPFGDFFGASVSVSGDVILVGADSDDTEGGKSAGSVYVYRFNGTSWVEETHLLASDGEGGDRFGDSVSVSGAVAIVGAISDDTAAGARAGSAYVYRFNGKTWVEEAHLFASDGALGDEFGRSVSISSIPGSDVAIVGANLDDTQDGQDAGSVYVFRYNGSTWIEEAHLSASDGAMGDYFGTSISISSSPQGEIIIVGAFRDTTVAGNQVGSAYVYRFNETSWVEEAHLHASDGGDSDHFGIAVSASSNVVVAGAYSDDTTAGFAVGSAYVYRFNGTTWVEETHLMASDGATGDSLGNSVSVSGDVVFLGAYSDAVGEENWVGSAYLFNIQEPPAICRGDIMPLGSPVGNGVVDIADLMAVLNGFGVCPIPPLPCYADITPVGGGNGVVNIDDLVAVLNGFGACP